MNAARSTHSATLLPSGKVLVAGGFDGSPISSTELFDPATVTWTPAGGMGFARRSHTATLLPNGKVLVAGGENLSGTLLTAQLYDPPADNWLPMPAMTTARVYHSATLLPNGSVMVAGGRNFNGALRSVDLFDPQRNAWVASTDLLQLRTEHAATLLGSGKVLLSGGGLSGVNNPSAEIFDYHVAYVGSPSQLYTMTNPIRRGESPAIATGVDFFSHLTAAGGGTGSSPTNFPTLQLMRIDNGQTTMLPIDPANPYATELFSSPASALAGWPVGHVHVHVFTNGTLNSVPTGASVISRVIAPGILDIDRNSSYDARTDGLLVIRYLFGLTGTSLTNGAIGSAATVSDPAAIKTYLDSVRSALDIDGNSQTDALTDGLLIVRYLFGLRGMALTTGAVGANAARPVASGIEAYLQTLMP